MKTSMLTGRVNTMELNFKAGLDPAEVEFLITGASLEEQAVVNRELAIFHVQALLNELKGE